MGYTGGSALGLFLLGVAPGGGQSNMFCKILNGDMSVSVTMTTLSTLASIGKFYTETTVKVEVLVCGIKLSKYSGLKEIANDKHTSALCWSCRIMKPF